MSRGRAGASVRGSSEAGMPAPKDKRLSREQLAALEEEEQRLAMRWVEIHAALDCEDLDRDREFAIYADGRERSPRRKAGKESRREKRRDRKKN